MIVKAKSGDVLLITNHHIGCLIYEGSDSQKWVFGGVLTKVSRRSLMNAIWAEVKNKESTFNWDDAVKLYAACINLWPEVYESRELADRDLEMQSQSDKENNTTLTMAGFALLWVRMLLQMFKQSRSD